MQDITAHIRLLLFGGLICKGCRKIMNYELAKQKDLHTVYDIVQQTIKTIYPKYYPTEVVNFFCELHSREAIEKYDTAYLDASLPAAAIYEKLGFSTVKHEHYPVENGVILAYEVNEQTVFLYHQNGSLLWAEYSGGDILKGSLIGSVSDNGEIDFVYHHMNKEMQVKTGKCHSVPTVKENEKIELSEQWEWTSGDCYKGESLLVEV